MKKNVIPNYSLGQITGNILYLRESRFPADIQRKQTGAWGQDQADWALHSNPTTAPSEGQGIQCFSLCHCAYFWERDLTLLFTLSIFVFTVPDGWREGGEPASDPSVLWSWYLHHQPTGEGERLTNSLISPRWKKDSFEVNQDMSYTTPVKNYWQNFDNCY